MPTKLHEVTPPVPVEDPIAVAMRAHAKKLRSEDEATVYFQARIILASMVDADGVGIAAPQVFEELGFVDVFRRLNDRPEQYTWWSNRGQAWKKNVGWRIDYQIATPGVAATARKESIYKAKRFSDHAPLVIDYDYRPG